MSVRVINGRYFCRPFSLSKDGPVCGGCVSPMRLAKVDILELPEPGKPKFHAAQKAESEVTESCCRCGRPPSEWVQYENTYTAEVENVDCRIF